MRSRSSSFGRRKPWTPPSQPLTPLLQPWGSPASFPALPPPFVLQEVPVVVAARAQQAPRQRRERWSSYADSEDDMANAYGRDDDEDAGSEGPDGFSPSYFVGDWLDSLGHHITVMPLDARQRRGVRLSYLATLCKPGVPNKKFTIAKDRVKNEWMCGNGLLVREESGWESITWQTADGRSSSWSRPVVEGPVYFDPAPEMQHDGTYASEAAVYHTMDAYGNVAGAYFWAGPAPADQVYGMWEAPVESTPFSLNANAPEFQPSGLQQDLPLDESERTVQRDTEARSTPPSTRAPTPQMTPINTPLQTPMIRPVPPPLMPLPMPLSPEALTALNDLSTNGPAPQPCA